MENNNKYNCRGIFDTIKDNDPSFNQTHTHTQTYEDKYTQSQFFFTINSM